MKTEKPERPEVSEEKKPAKYWRNKLLGHYEVGEWICTDPWKPIATRPRACEGIEFTDFDPIGMANRILEKHNAKVVSPEGGEPLIKTKLEYSHDGINWVDAHSTSGGKEYKYQRQIKLEGGEKKEEEQKDAWVDYVQGSLDIGQTDDSERCWDAIVDFKAALKKEINKGFLWQREQLYELIDTLKP